MRWWILALLLIGNGALADTYRWVDEDGVVNFSDQPHPGAERIDLRAVQTYSPPEWTQRERSTETRSESETGAETSEASGQSITILRPQQEENLWNIEGILDVVVDVQPTILPGTRMRLYLDGKPVTGVTGAGSTFAIDKVYRGAHTLRAAIEDGRGRQLAVSDTVRFHVHQGTVDQTLGPSPRPPSIQPVPTPLPRRRGGG